MIKLLHIDYGQQYHMSFNLELLVPIIGAIFSQNNKPFLFILFPEVHLERGKESSLILCYIEKLFFGGTT